MMRIRNVGTSKRFFAVVLGFLVVTAAAASKAALPLATDATVQTNTWMNVTGTLAGMTTECGNLMILSSVPGSDTVLAGVARKGLWANNGGTKWVHVSGTSQISNRPSSVVYDPLHTGVYWESGIYNGAGVYQTTDNGITFQQLGEAKHIDYLSVNFRDPERQTLLGGGHEAPRTVYLSSDRGQTWTNVGANLPPNTGFSQHPIVINSFTYLVDVLSGGAANNGGIYRTVDSGSTWRRVSDRAPSAPPLVAANHAIYWPANGGLLRSVDLGATWTQVGNGVRPVQPIELPDGRLVSVGDNALIISADGGSKWTAFGAVLPFSPAGVVYSTGRRAFFIWHSTCEPVVLSDAVMQIQ
jgi:photosystem II stability/assembly factor-like uncharacterized protein